MNEQNIPIDINTSKLLNWLLSRQHVSKDWHNQILKIREKINNAIQDMPEHTEIVKLLSGQHINYFHCLNIIEILKETEANSKNLFGQYGSKRMKDWQDIISCYQKDNVYLAEASQLLTRNVTYEVPSLRKQITKCELTELECRKKIKDYSKNEATTLNDFHTSCKQLGIKGENIKGELVALLAELPIIYEQIAVECKTLDNAIELYRAFVHFGSESNDNILPVLSFVVNKGNTSTYEYVYGEKPISIELPEEEHHRGQESSENDDAIDFGDEEIDFGGNSDSNFSIITDVEWSKTDDGFEIVDHEDIDTNESGIAVENVDISGNGGVARGLDALTILNNPKTHDLFYNDLMELDAFLKMRLYELSNESDLLTMTLIQDAPPLIQVQTIESIASMKDAVNIILNNFSNKRLQHLHNVKHSPNYIDMLTENLNHKLALVDKIKVSKSVLEEQIEEGNRLRVKTLEIIQNIVESTKTLQKEIEGDIAKKYKGRPVHITGGINLL